MLSKAVTARPTQTTSMSRHFPHMLFVVRIRTCQESVHGPMLQQALQYITFYACCTQPAPDIQKCALMCDQFPAIAGGRAEADAAYEDAMDAVFGLEVDHYSHILYQELPQAVGRTKSRWELIELWPLQVRIPCLCMHLSHMYMQLPHLHSVLFLPRKSWKCSAVLQCLGVRV